MNRRRLLWFGIPLIVLGGIVAAWFWMWQRDRDFVVIGPKTKRIRDTLALLDQTIDPADFRNCKTRDEAILRFFDTLPLSLHRDVPFRWGQFKNSAFTLPAATRLITGKEFLRMAHAKSESPDAVFIVRDSHITITTAERAQEIRARYRGSVSVYDRIHNFWKEMTGAAEPDAPVLISHHRGAL